MSEPAIDPRLRKSVLLSAVASVARKAVIENGPAIDAVAGKPPAKMKAATDSGIDPRFGPLGAPPIALVMDKIGIVRAEKIRVSRVNRGHTSREERRRLRRMEASRKDREPLSIGTTANTLSSGW